MKKATKLFLLILPVFLLIAVGILKLSLEGPDFIGSTDGCGCDFGQATGGFEASEKQAYFLESEVLPPLVALVEPELPSVLGEVSPNEKWIEIDLSEQKLIAWERETKFLETLISAGKWGRTPTGEFNIWGKYKYTKMSGGSKEDHTYYYLPNVPYTMYFYKGFGLHGTYWHNNFGTPMSHGCVNMPTTMAEKVFYWSTPALASGKNYIASSKENPGTRVVIHE